MHPLHDTICALSARDLFSWTDSATYVVVASNNIDCLFKNSLFVPCCEVTCIHHALEEV